MLIIPSRSGAIYSLTRIAGKHIDAEIDMSDVETDLEADGNAIYGILIIETDCRRT